MKRIIFLILLLFTVSFSGNYNIKKEDKEYRTKDEIIEAINIDVLNLRKLEKSQKKNYKKISELKAKIAKFDKKYPRYGRMMYEEEINNTIKIATNNNKKEDKVATKIVLTGKAKKELDKANERHEKVIEKIENKAAKKADEINKKVDEAIAFLSGDVSHYGYNLHGSKTATGGKFDQWAMTAAHKSLPFGTILRVTNKSNGKSVTVRINDRGPYIKGRVLDLSRGAFVKIAPQKQGILKANNVKIEVLKYGNGNRKENR